MDDKEWTPKPNDRALLPVSVTATGENGWVQVAVGHEADGYYLSVDGANLIPDYRHPSWGPGQPGDVAVWGGRRHFCEQQPGSLPEWFDERGEGTSDADVPADARILLPAKTRDAQQGARKSDDWVISDSAENTCVCGHPRSQHGPTLCVGTTALYSGSLCAGTVSCSCTKYVPKSSTAGE